MSSSNSGVFATLASDSPSEDPVDALLLAEFAARLATSPEANPLDAVLSDFRSAGFDGEVRAWLAPGLSASPPPLPVDALTRVAQPHHVIDNEWLTGVGTRNGIKAEVVLRRYASLLPRAIKDLTPRGEVPSQRALAIGLEALRRRGAR